MYDVIVIGAGLAGLSSALKLSKSGKKVAIFEKHFMPGGYSTNFKRKDKEGNLYIFDVALHGIGGLLPGNIFYKYMKNIDMIDKVNFLRKLETGTIYSFNKEIDVPDSFNEYREHLIKRYKNEEEGIINLFNNIYELKKEMESGKPPIIYQRLQNISLYDYLKSFIDNEDLIEEFSFLWLYYGLPPKKLNALYYILAWISYHIGGTFYVKGGAGKLADTFAEEIRKNGGDIFLSNEVTKIEVEDNKVKVIYTKKGEKYEANQFIFACDPNNLINLIENKSETVIKYKEKLDNKEIGISLSQLYIGLDCKTAEVGINKGDYLISEVHSETAYENAINGDYLNTTFGLTSYDILDPELNKDVGVFVVVFGDNIDNWPEYKTDEYINKKKKVTDDIINLVCRYFPEVKDHIKIAELGTPHTMKRYTNNSKGAVYGWEQNVSQGGFNRLSIKSDFSNVYLAGSWTNPGGGFEGAITGGILTAQRILKDEKNNLKKAKYKEDNELIDPDMNLKSFMIGMVANFDKNTVSKDKELLFEFIFDEKDKFYIQIKNRKAKLLKELKNDKIDVIVKTSYKEWYNIAFNGVDGRNSMFDGKLNVFGDVDEFLNIPKYFNSNSYREEKKVEKKKLNTLFWIIVSLVPWILSGIIGEFYKDTKIISLSAILYTSIVILFIKPKQFKEVTKLEGLTLISFSIYGIIGEDISIKVLKIILILAFVLSVVINKPITSDYSKQSYNDSMVRTKLFNKINVFLTLLWVVIFTIQFIGEIFITSSWNNLLHILSILGLVISYYYPKWILE